MAIIVCDESEMKLNFPLAIDDAGHDGASKRTRIRCSTRTPLWQLS